MAAVVGDFIADPNHFHGVNASSSLQQYQHCQNNHNRDSSLYDLTHQPPADSTSTPRSLQQKRTSVHCPAQNSDLESPRDLASPSRHRHQRAAARLPSPPASSSPSVTTASSHENVTAGCAKPMESQTITTTTTTREKEDATRFVRQQPSPAADDGTQTSADSAIRPSSSFQSPLPTAQVVHVRDIAHVQSLAKTNILRQDNSEGCSTEPQRYEISGMPISDVIEMVAALLTKITTTNDSQHDAMSRNATHQQQASWSNDAGGKSGMSPLSHSVLAFHGKNVPAITIHSYLSRIHKYCPTTFEVFLSLLVYFDRMTERVNELVAKADKARKNAPSVSTEEPSATAAAKVIGPADAEMRDAGDGDLSDECDSDLADDDDRGENDHGNDEHMAERPSESRRSSHVDGDRIVTANDDEAAFIGSPTYFVVDSFNIHRLIIAGVTCASKFFSDVFYTNSRYAKVGGLPLTELNHLELQFLVLNEFRLAIRVEELEAYATMLVEFYAREVVASTSSSAE